jgi:predicted outer membrane repeat protein
MNHFLSAAAAVLLLIAACSDDERPTAPHKQPPTLSSVTPGDTTVSVGDTVFLTLEAEDSDGRIIGYTYTAGDSSGLVDSAGVSKIVFDDSGSYIVTFTAVDNDSLVSTDEVSCSVTVVLDPPMLDSLSRGDTGLVVTGDTVTVTAHATDRYGSVVSYVWTRGDSSDTTAGASYGFVVTAAGSDTLAVRALDEDDQKSSTVTMILDVVEPAAVTRAPADTVIAAGSPLTLVCGAAGTEAAFAWWRNDSLLNDQTDSTLTIDTVTMADSGVAYRCVVSNAAGTDTSAAATITVLRLATIAVAPTDAVISPNYDARFSLTATGSDIAYRWQFEGEDMEGADSSVLVFELAPDSLNGSAFRCIVSNMASADTSEYVRILFTDKPVIISQPVGDTVELDSTAVFTVAATSPGEFTYRWLRDGEAIDSNATDSAYTLAAVAGDDHGALFRCILTNDYGSDTTDEVALYVLASPMVTVNPVDTGVYPGDTAVFTVAAEGMAMTWQWLEDGSPVAGATDSMLVVRGLTLDDDSTVYSCIVENDFGADTSAGALLTVYGVIHVKAGAADGGDGSSWARAYGVLQEAIDAASGGTQIWVSRGTYTPADTFGGTTERHAAFRMKNRVAIYGGFAGNETKLDSRKVKSNATILSGDLGVGTDESDDAYHVINNAGLALDATAVLDGFIVECGNADGGGADAMGGGMLCDGGSPAIVNCTFRKNLAVTGGAIGGDAAGPSVRHCTFEDNGARSGGAVRLVRSTPRFVDCTFARNAADSMGGALLSDTATVLVLESCTFTRDSASRGGALCLAGGMASLSECTIDSNTATMGGGVAVQEDGSYELSYCTFRANTASWGGAIAASAAATVSGEQMTFESNIADSLGGAVYVGASGPSGALSGTFVAQTCRFVKNAATAGGALFGDSTSDIRLTAVYAEQNSASSGGALYVTGDAVVDSARFFTNSADEGSGGALYVAGREVGIGNARFSGNAAGQSGGALHIATAARCTVMTATFLRNGARDGGGLSVAPGSSSDTLVFSDIQFLENSAVVRGGGAYAASTALFDSALFNKNSASLGGGLYSTTECPLLRTCTLSANAADLDGGGSFVDGCSLTADDATVYEGNSPNDTN